MLHCSSAGTTVAESRLRGSCGGGGKSTSSKAVGIAQLFVFCVAAYLFGAHSSVRVSYSGICVFKFQSV